MRIAILSRKADLYSTRRIVEAARKQEHIVEVYDPVHFSIGVSSNNPTLYYEGEKFTGADAVIPRIGASITFYGVAVVRQMEQMGIFCANESQAIARSRDKLRALQVLSRHKIGMPPTEFVRTKADILPAIERLGGAPVILKVLEGTQGIGVILAETAKMAEAVIEAFQGARQNLLIQKFVKESKGKDIRAFVVGNRVVAAMRRSSTSSGEFRSNVHLGGKVSKVNLPREFKETAIRAAQIVGLHIAGVDMLETKEGPAVMEVNSSPGLEGIETATGVDVAGEIIGFLEERARFPQVQLEQMLRFKEGYVVVSAKVAPDSPLAGKTLREGDLTSRDIFVLGIERGSFRVNFPHADSRIEVGDTLICYGKLTLLRELLPAPDEPKKPRVRRRAGTRKA
ncbi:MAG TPA: 30S ribosomal protein S6--L-glutamate ligase [Planctomycetota bacterium]|nr:30S ribosomal protein S6--L-glutamate ligase [Planctomycetota bacterium]